MVDNLRQSKFSPSLEAVMTQLIQLYAANGILRFSGDFKKVGTPLILFLSLLASLSLSLHYNVTGLDCSHGLSALSHVWQHVKLLDALSWAFVR